MAKKYEYDEEESRKTERAYLAPAVVRRRMRTVGMMAQYAGVARESGMVSEAESQGWLDGLERLGAQDAYFFCVNRFLFSAVKR